MFDDFLRQVFHLFEPIGFVWLCLVLLASFAWRKKRRVVAAILGACFLLLTIVGSTGVPGALLGSLERPYAGTKPEDLPTADAVVLLGGGVEPARYEAGGIHLTRAGDRLMMVLKVLQLRKAPVLVLGGGGDKLDGDFVSESKAVAGWYGALRDSGALDPKLEIVPLSPCGNTHDEALATRAVYIARGWRNVLLVTSANHMRRAEALFRTAGMSTTPVPCNFLTSISTAGSGITFGLPAVDGFDKVAIWLHEELGWIECKRRGWIQSRP